MKTNSNCLLCGKKTIIKTTQQLGYRSPDLYKIFHCPFCNTSFSSPRTNAKEIYQIIYKHGDKVPGYDRYWKYQKEVLTKDYPFEYLANAEPVYWGILDTLNNKLNLSSNTKIIEIGCGLGYLTYCLQKSGFHSALGLDIAQEAIQNAKQTFGDYYVCADLFEYAEAYQNSFDIIIMTEVIEHVEDPLKYISALKIMTKKSGIIIFTTPNKSFYPDSAVWNTDLPPIHCWWFSEDSVRYMAFLLGLNCSFTDFSTYYKTHPKILYHKDYCTRQDSTHILDENNNLIQTSEAISKTNHGIFPRWFKETNIYKNISTELYPKLSKKYVVSGKRTYSMCVLLSKKEV